MDIFIFVVCLVFGLVLTLLGLRSSPLAIISICFNLAVFTTALVSGVSEQIPIATEIIETTYDVYPALLLPVFFIVLSVVKVVKYR